MHEIYHISISNFHSITKRNQIHVRINIINLMGLETFQGQLFFYHVKLCGVTITLLHEMLQN